MTWTSEEDTMNSKIRRGATEGRAVAAARYLGAAILLLMLVLSAKKRARWKSAIDRLD